MRPDERSARYRHGGAVVWLTGLPGSGKSTLARALERRLFGNGGSPVLLDGDTCAPASTAISASPPTTAPKTSAGWPKSPPISRATGISPLSRRSRPRRKIAPRRAASPIPAFREIYVATPVEVCESRDPKGHYAKARAGSLHAFTGIGNDYQPPTDSELTIDTSTRSVTEATDEIERMLVRSGILFDEPVDLAANI